MHGTGCDTEEAGAEPGSQDGRGDDGDAREPRDHLEVFTERDFKGVSQKLAVGNYEASYDLHDLSVAGGVGGDTISSLKMPNVGGQGYGFTVTLYADPGFRGASKSFRGDADYVGDDLNDKTSSIRIISCSRSLAVRGAVRRHGSARDVAAPPPGSTGGTERLVVHVELVPRDAVELAECRGH